MPELPEVETVRRTLLPVVQGKTISGCDLYYPRVLPKNTPEDFLAEVVNHSILDILRRGKYLIFTLNSKLRLIFHLRMTGQLIFRPRTDTEFAKHTSLRFHFTDESQLHFVDQRKFGTVYLLPESEYSKITGLYTLGPEPLSAEFTPEYLGKIVGRNRVIKAILLDQKNIAGLGNIYVDEALFQAGIHPARVGSSLREGELVALHKAIVAVLKDAINNHGTTIKDYRTGSGDTGHFQNKLQVYGRTGQECNKCHSLLIRTRIAGRGTHFCPICQRWEQECEG